MSSLGFGTEPQTLAFQKGKSESTDEMVCRLFKGSALGGLP